MKTCRHLKDVAVTATPVGPLIGAPPWMTLCEDCSATAFEAVRFQQAKIEEANKARPISGKSGRAGTWARIRRWLEDLGEAGR